MVLDERYEPVVTRSFPSSAFCPQSRCQNGLLRDRPPKALVAIAGLSLGLAALEMRRSFFAESTLFLGGKKNRKSLGDVSGNQRLRSCPVRASTQ